MLRYSRYAFVLAVLGCSGGAAVEEEVASRTESTSSGNQGEHDVAPEGATAAGSSKVTGTAVSADEAASIVTDQAIPIPVNSVVDSRPTTVTVNNNTGFRMECFLYDNIEGTVELDIARNSWKSAVIAHGGTLYYYAYAYDEDGDVAIRWTCVPNTWCTVDLGSRRTYSLDLDP